MTASEYESRFEKLSRFPSYLTYTHDKVQKAAHFEKGLRLEIRNKVAALEIKNSIKLANECRIIEKDIPIMEVKIHKRKQIREEDYQSAKNQRKPQSQ